MKRFLLAVLALLVLAACEQAEGDMTNSDVLRESIREYSSLGEDEPAWQSSRNEEPKPSQEPQTLESSEEWVEPNLRERPDALIGPAREGWYEPAEWNDWQEDPTLIESPYLDWEHLEYRLFGDSGKYVRYEKEITPFGKHGSLLEGQRLKISYLLPPDVVDDSVLEMDVGFEKGDLKIGEIPAYYYVLEDGENPFELDGGNFNRETITGSGMGEPDPQVSTKENVPGGVYQTKQFLRGISSHMGGLMTYYIHLNGKMLSMYFYISPQAAVEDLELYDAIAASIEIVE